jgi:sarcosine oxidase subunit beta
MPETADVIVVGAGIIGCSIAYRLAASGRQVVVVDRGPAAGAGSTSSSSAVIRFHYSTLDGVITSWESKHLWARWEDFLGGGDESGLARFHQVGMLVIDPPADPRTATVLGLFDKVGVPYQVFGPAELARAFPALDTGRYWPPKAVADPAFWDGPNGQLGAYFTPDGGFVDDPQLAAHNLMTAAVREGARFLFRTEVTAVTSASGRIRGVAVSNGASISAPVVINAAGPFSARLNAMAGVIDEFSTISTRPLRQEVHVVPATADFRLEHGGTVVNDGDLGTYFRPQPGGSIVIGGLEPDCDPLVWVDDPDTCDPHPSVAAWEAQVFRAARRVPDLQVPARPAGLGALYDVTPDWVPIYDRTNLDGFFVAIGTSGNQFKNAPLVGRLMEALIDGAAHHDSRPVRYRCEETGHEIDLSHYSRLRRPATTSNTVLG